MLRLHRSCLAVLVAVASACGSSSDGETSECLALAPCASARLVNARTLVDGFLVVLKNADDPEVTPLPSAPAVPPVGLNAFFDHGSGAFGFDADLDGLGGAESPLRGTASGTSCNGMNAGHVCVFDWGVDSSLLQGSGKFSFRVLSEGPPRSHLLTIVDVNPVFETAEECRLEITLLALYMNLYEPELFYSPVQLGFQVTRGTDVMEGTFIGENVTGTCNDSPFSCTLNQDDFALSSCTSGGT